MIIEINGLYAGLRFASAHIIFGHHSCGSIHGHTYYVDIKLDGNKKLENYGFVYDFKVIKKIAKEICRDLDHKLLIPKNHDNIHITFENNHTIIKYENKEYKIPSEDLKILPTKSTTAEELSIYFTKKLIEELNKYNNKIDNINWIECKIYEGLGQCATYRHYL